MAKVFISHSSIDKDVVRLFKDIVLKFGIGLTDADIFFTSSPETGVPVGGNIPEYIKNNLKDCDFAFLMISENYKKSEVCLNEMGAAMVLGKKLFPVILYNYEFDKVGWLIDRNLCARIDDVERLNEIRDVFVTYSISTSTNVWNKYRDEFLCKLSSMSKSDKKLVVKGLLDCQLEIKRNQDIYTKNISYVNKITPDYEKKSRSIVEKHNQSLDLEERKILLEDLANVLNRWADELEKVVPEICSSLENSLKAVEDILRIKTLPNEDKKFWVNDLSYFCSLCEGIYPTLLSSKRTIESQVDMLQSQILAKKRLLNSYDSLLEVYDVSINKIREIINSGKEE